MKLYIDQVAEMLYFFAFIKSVLIILLIFGIHVDPISYVSIVDVLIIILLALGVQYYKSRLCAVIALVYFIVSRNYYFEAYLNNGIFLIISIIEVFLSLMAVYATVRYHMLKQSLQNGKEYNMECEKCGVLNHDEAKYCNHCGALFSKLRSKDLGTITPVFYDKRLINFIIDMFCMLILSTIIGMMFELNGLAGVIEHANSYLLGAIIISTYYILFESLFSKSPAKFITNTKVVSEDGSKPRILQIVIRTLVRFIPFEPFSFVGYNPVGWHDKLSRTRVVKG